MGIVRKRAIRYPLILLSLVGLVAAILMMSWKLWIGLIFGLLYMGIIVYAWKVEQITYNETEKHIESLSYRMKNVGEEAFLELPIGILLINEQY